MARGGFQGKNESPDLESRLLAVESRVASFSTQSVDASASVGAGAPNPSLAPSPVNGLALVSNVPGAISVRWNLNTGNVDRYEVWVSTNSSFFPANTVSKYTLSNRTNTFLYTEGTDPNIPYYVRVRAFGDNGAPGPFSGTLNASTGKVTATLIDKGVISAFSRTSSLLGNVLSVSTTGETSSAEVGETNLQVELEEVALLISGAIKCSFLFTAGTRLVVTPIVEDLSTPEKKVDALTEYVYVFGTGSLPAESAIVTYPAIDIYTPRAKGLYRFRIRVELSIDTTLGGTASYRDITLEKLDLSVIQLRK